MHALSTDRWRISSIPRPIKPQKFSDRWLLGPKPPWPSTVAGWVHILIDPPFRVIVFSTIIYIKVLIFMWLFHLMATADHAGLLGPQWRVPQISEMLGVR